MDCDGVTRCMMIGMGKAGTGIQKAGRGNIGVGGLLFSWSFFAVFGFWVCDDDTRMT